MSDEAFEKVSTTTSGSKVAIYADWPNAFAIVDRIGLSVELVPHVFGASQRPIGARGVYAYWRTGSGVLSRTRRDTSRSSSEDHGPTQVLRSVALGRSGSWSRRAR
jgi:hypothetical protein